MFELYDGGAEVYRALNVRGAANQLYASNDGPGVLVDIFDMGSCSDAYGAYRHDIREGPSAGLGRESERAGSSVFFWKSTFFVSVVPLANTSRSREGALRLAEAVASRIEVDGEIPEIVTWLPNEGLVESHVHYFHTAPLLERHQHLADANELLLDHDTEGVLARYRDEAERHQGSLLLVRYPTMQRAESARQRFAVAQVDDAQLGRGSFAGATCSSVCWVLPRSEGHGICWPGRSAARGVGMKADDRLAHVMRATGILVVCAAAAHAGCKEKPPSQSNVAESQAPAKPAPKTPSAAFTGLTAVLPDKAGGYLPQGEDGRYDRDTLFDLINGGAEVFLALNVRAVISRRYAKAGAPELTVDVFDMGSDADAYGAYHHDIREGKSAGFGNESELGGSSVFFWKDRYYVSVVAFANTDASRTAVVEMGKAVADRIKNAGKATYHRKPPSRAKTNPKSDSLLPHVGALASTLPL